MNLEDIMLGERNQTEKDKYCVCPCGILKKKRVKLIEAESSMLVTRGWGWGKWEQKEIGKRVKFRKRKKEAVTELTSPRTVSLLMCLL